MLKWALVVIANAVLAAILIFYLFWYRSDLSIDYVDQKYGSPESEFLTLQKGARLHFRDEGNQNGLPLVLVHGSNASLHTFEPWVTQLAEEYRLITLDLPGHGLTGATPDRDYSMEAFVRALDQLVEHLDIQRFVLGGNSMGGHVTWRYAMEYPEKVIAMLLIDASGYFGEEASLVVETEKGEEGEENESVLVFNLLQQPWFRVIVPYLDPWYLTKQGVKSAYNNSEVVDEKLIYRYYELALRKGTRQATVDRFASFDPASQVKMPDRLMQPTLVIWGREDALIDVAVAWQFKAAIPQAEVIVYDQVGHVPMEEIPEKSAMDVRAFLRSLGNRH